MPTKKKTGLELLKELLDFAAIEYQHEPAVEPTLVVRGKNGSEVRMTFDSDGDLKATEGIGGEYTE
jgi:hypothetical protein